MSRFLPDGYLPALNAEQRAAFLDVVRADPKIGNAVALAQIGIKGSRGQLRALVDEDLREETREARGRQIEAVEQKSWDVAQDTTHPSWDRANARILKAYGGQQFREQQHVELTGADGGPVEVEDRSASLPDVLAVLTAAGLTQDGSGTTGAEVAEPQDVLPDPADG